MSKDGTRFVICYDVPDDKRRTRLSKLLDSYGDRVQFSVFEAVLNEKLFDKLIGDIDKIIDPEKDIVTVYWLCAACAKRVKRLGAVPEGPLVGEEIVFVV